jgi:hypothetical protein
MGVISGVFSKKNCAILKSILSSAIFRLEYDLVFFYDIAPTMDIGIKHCVAGLLARFCVAKVKIPIIDPKV